MVSITIKDSFQIDFLSPNFETLQNILLDEQLNFALFERHILSALHLSTFYIFSTIVNRVLGDFSQNNISIKKDL